MNSIQTTSTSSDAGATGAVMQRTVTEGEYAAPEAHDTPTRDPDISTTVSALLFWVIALGIVGFLYFRTECADVLLNVMTQSQSGDAAAKPLAVSVDGSVLVDGKPVTNGQLQISVHDADRKSYLASAVVRTLDGSFKTSFSLPAVAIDQKLRVDASYLGFRGAEGEQKKIMGSISRFVRAPDPLGTSRVVTLLSVLAGLIILLIILFTGELTRPKARLLFIATYFVTFIALVLPIALTVLLTRNPYLADIMREAPIGLVKGISGETVRKEQWLLNIGGTVRPAQPAAAGSNSGAPATPTQTPATGATAGGAGAGAAADGTTLTTPPAQQAQVLAPTAATSNSGLRPAPLQNVDGGLVVPFYILILAMFGAGINMTRQVPQIQSSYDEKITPRRESVVIATLHAPLKMFQYAAITNPTEREAAAHIRKRLIDSYMYLLAAPFLAIAVYYLLQVLAENTAEPVLVLMAFSTGLVSDSIVSRIASFAEGTIAVAGGARQPQAAEQPAQQPQPAPPQQQGQQAAEQQLEARQLTPLPVAQTPQALHSQAQQAVAPQGQVGVRSQAAQAQTQIKTETQEAISQEVHEAEVVAENVQREADQMFAQVKDMLNIPETVTPTTPLDTPANSPDPAGTNETKETIDRAPIPLS